MGQKVSKIRREHARAVVSLTRRKEHYDHHSPPPEEIWVCVDDKRRNNSWRTCCDRDANFPVHLKPSVNMTTVQECGWFRALTFVMSPEA